ncbi:MAG: methylenetetrahydrofolate reductase [NAD(P)H] [Emergencia timonensis]|uniref:methylenetetrahydrofolate reductase [NAD(P)H] n=1 Tax=Emergencia timonensis TaxID=1776384 RepID=UPI000834BE2D|nr:methylenetetrahydrofolate reductase [NAD(P)H] [Emergencia timonensis]WNX90575.1 methylenetetrahydrofolate reductase [NAD(P)H] [Emergencia timonensis]
MKLAELFNNRKTVFSFEVFPPKRDNPIETIYNTLDALQDLKPDFISVTYGASGSLADNSTCEIASAIKHRYGIESAAHLTCVNSTKEEVTQVLKKLHDNGVENILALRGDLVPDVEPKEDFKHASELITFIRESENDFGISGACYPEGHLDSRDQIEDILNLKKKVDAGAQHLISQLFFDNNLFYDFLDKARIAGINVPIEAGIMPVVNKKQIERMVSLCGASLPAKFTKMMSRYETRPEAMRDAGIAYAVNQIVDLVSQGVDGVHLYTMNNPYIAKRISESVKSLF